MRPVDQHRWTAEGYGGGLARTIIAVRIAVVISVGVLLSVEPPGVRVYLAMMLAAAMVYSAIVFVHPQLEVRRTRYRWLVTGFDSMFALGFIVLTGGVHSPAVSVLVLVVIASAARLSFTETLALGMLLGAGYIAVALLAPTAASAALAPVPQSGWWALYLLFTAIITAGLSSLAEHEHRSTVRALVEAEAEHAAAEEERDLRSRLLQSYQSQQDGLQVLVHEFRTPVASLEALADALTSARPMTESDRAASLRLASRHVEHLSDMLDALSDVALSRRPTFSAGRVRRVDIAGLITAAADAVGLVSPQPRLTVSGDVGVVAVNAQGLRRVLTNLLENASRHSRDASVDVTCARTGNEIVIEIADRGPGLPARSLGELTAKYVSVGDRRGTAGLGLWIVQQILEAIGGRVDFSARDGGGLVATVRAPIS
ncbi:sensor histidine kinase [Candidatus Mycolicibacterium alkanivorans]|uniref:histidine kinase n=1 Tax=Candidatus Mycolicibacterium alkanivorans TaxID=2954114 RepID=A0ABS9YZF5_9MYCO|nr:HAMP domain-containing sensor histidine kinase [Candidatus Mycolicibacterium alkanivorans]MCI4676472.1 HAMP domain-containing histidine kinase [Candidatus Mycolicibacterium alkanivorans]